jgi:hypothetical protein
MNGIPELTDNEATTLYEQVKREYKAYITASERLRTVLREIHAVKIDSTVTWNEFVDACGGAPTALALMEYRRGER